MPSLYLTELVWNTDLGGFWEPPVTALGMLDFRSIPECGDKVTPAPPKALVALSQPDSNVSGALGSYANKEALDTQLVPGAAVSMMESSLGLKAGSITSSTMTSIIAELFTHLSDPTGQTQFKPLLSNVIYLGGFSPIWRGNWRADPVWRGNLIATYQNDYREIRQWALAHQSNVSARWLGFNQSKLGIPASELIPKGMPPEKPIPPHTTIGDTFVDTNGTLLTAHTATGTGGGWSWTETATSPTEWSIESNNASHSSNAVISDCRAGTALSGADMYAQVNAVTVVGATSSTLLGPSARYSPSADTMYAMILQENSGSDSLNIQKCVASTTTVLKSQTWSKSTPETAKISCNGSLLTGYLAGASVISLTDTSITGNTNAGIRGYTHVAGDCVLGTFVAADLPATSSQGALLMGSF